MTSAQTKDAVAAYMFLLGEIHKKRAEIESMQSDLDDIWREITGDARQAIQQAVIDRALTSARPVTSGQFGSGSY